MEIYLSHTSDFKFKVESNLKIGLNKNRPNSTDDFGLVLLLRYVKDLKFKWARIFSIYRKI